MQGWPLQLQDSELESPLQLKLQTLRTTSHGQRRKGPTVAPSLLNYAQVKEWQKDTQGFSWMLPVL